MNAVALASASLAPTPPILGTAPDRLYGDLLLPLRMAPTGSNVIGMINVPGFGSAEFLSWRGAAFIIPRNSCNSAGSCVVPGADIKKCIADAGTSIEPLTLRLMGTVGGGSQALIQCRIHSGPGSVLTTSLVSRSGDGPAQLEGLEIRIEGGIGRESNIMLSYAVRRESGNDEGRIVHDRRGSKASFYHRDEEFGSVSGERRFKLRGPNSPVHAVVAKMLTCIENPAAFESPLLTARAAGVPIELLDPLHLS
jgi:hypothetical protein